MTTARAILDEYAVARVGAAGHRDVLYALHRMEAAVRMLLEHWDEHFDLTPDRPAGDQKRHGPGPRSPPRY